MGCVTVLRPVIIMFRLFFATCLVAHCFVEGIHATNNPTEEAHVEAMPFRLDVESATQEEPSEYQNEQFNVLNACVLNITDWLENSSGGVINQDPCDYTGITLAYRRCTQLRHVDLESLVRTRERMSGQETIQAFEAFCENRKAIHECVEDFLKRYKCPKGDVDDFYKHSGVAEYYCDGNTMRSSVAKIYRDIPAVGTSPSEDACMKQAYDRHDTCLLPLLLAAVLQNTKDVQKMDWKLDNLVCVLRGFGSKRCPVKKGILTSTLLHSPLLVPPALGVNVTRHIVDMDKYFRQHLAQTKQAFL